jgi:Carboxypeptidase regulatory-like domain
LSSASTTRNSAACVALALAAITLHAQSSLSDSGSLLGKLTDTHSVPLAEATVTLRNLATGASIQTVTGKNGSYRFAGLAPGEYSLAANVADLGNGEVEGIVISPSHATRVQAALVMELPPPPALPELGVHTLDPVSPAVTSTIASEEMGAIPLAARNWQAFAAITPAGNPIPQRGANGIGDAESDAVGDSFSFAPGALLNSTSVDGIPTAPAFRNQRLGSEPQSLGESAIQTVSARTGDAPAQQTAASVDLTTAHGQNGFHGQAFYYNRQNLFNAKNPFTQILVETSKASGIETATFATQPYSPPNSRQAFGFGIGSQIKRDKLFWFAALDGLLSNDPAVASVRHPDGFFAQPTIDDLQMLAVRIGPAYLQSGPACPAGSLPSAALEEQAAACYSGMLEQMTGLLGPVPRTSAEGQLFVRLDWQAAERHHLSMEANFADQNSPSGALTRTSETYASHSFGNSQAQEFFTLGRLDSFLTANLLATTALEFRRRGQSDSPQSVPTTGLEAQLAPFAFGQLPQIVADSRNGFVLGTPARLGKGNYPLENSIDAQETVSWVRGNHLLKAGASFDHISDAVDTLINQNGSYSYADLLNFISDTAAIEIYGLSGYDPTGAYHNCDATGRVYNRGGQANLGGLGPLPCYAWFTQRIGPANWHLSTNDLAAFVTDQWQPVHNLTISAGVRLERQQLPPPIAAVQNPDLAGFEKLPPASFNWGPRFGLAWSPASRTVLRAGAGLYYGRIDNSSILAALTQTGSLNGDLNYFFKPTDLGRPIFPTVFPGPPVSPVAPGGVAFAPRFRTQEVDQAVVSLEQQLPSRWVLSVSAMASLGRRLPVSIDTNFDPAGPKESITYAVEDPTHGGPIKSPAITVPLYTARNPMTPFSNYQQLSSIESRANSTYQAEMIKLVRNGGHGLSLRAHYLYAHATDWNPNESGNVAGNDILDPRDFGLEYGTSNLDIRHSAAATILYQIPHFGFSKSRDWAGWLANGWAIAAVGQFRSGLPFTMRAGGYIPGFYTEEKSLIQGVAPGINGSGGDNRVYGMGSDGTPYNIGRNTFRYPATWTGDARLSKRIMLPKQRELEFLGESFNLFNHQNVTLIETTGYTVRRGTPAGDLPTLTFLDGLTSSGQPSQTPEFGKPLDVNATNFYHPREFQLGLRLRF